MKQRTPPTCKGFSPAKLQAAGIVVDQHDFWVRDAVTNEVRLITAAEWEREMGK